MAFKTILLASALAFGGTAIAQHVLDVHGDERIILDNQRVAHGSDPPGPPNVPMRLFGRTAGEIIDPDLLCRKIKFPVASSRRDRGQGARQRGALTQVIVEAMFVS